MKRSLRVGVTRALIDGAAAATGRGRMWNEVLSRLAEHVDLRVLDDPARRRLRRPDVWLNDGHGGPLDVREPQVIQLQEAPWAEPETLATLDEEFLRLQVGPSEEAARRCAAVVCPSRASQRQIIHAYDLPAELVVVAPLGVDHRVFHPGVEGGTELLASHGGDPAVPYVLFVSSVHPRKNLPALRDAMSRLAQRGYPHQLAVVPGPAHGRPDHEDLTEAALAELPGAPGRVVHVPYGTSDAALAALYCSAEVFCMPSLAEGFGLPALEAMACGTPTVVADRSALAEVAGDAAIRVEPDADALESGLASLLDDRDRAQAVGRACRQRSQEFTWERGLTGWLAALDLAARPQDRHRSARQPDRTPAR